MQLEYSYARDLCDLVSPVQPMPMKDATLAVFNDELADALQIPAAWRHQTGLFEQLFSPQGCLNKQAVAQKYGGHQFGVWNPELGDGRGLLLAEWVDKTGKRSDLHLKGAGQTPYSRFGDGRAVLRSTIREYLASEALHALGIPTSRALCLLTSNEPVRRETLETAAMLIRTCQSHLRFGHFEYFYHTGEHDKLERLFDYTFVHHFPSCLQADNKYSALLSEITRSTARLIAMWQVFGFNHGVMNTDNMSIHGITFDYGPYAFLDDFEPAFVCNHSDHTGRYRFSQQPGIGLWNLNALAHSFAGHLTREQLQQCLGEYQPMLTETYSQMMLNKFGLQQVKPDDHTLINDWLALLEQDKRDYTQSFRLLSEVDASCDTQFIRDHFIDRQAAHNWLIRYQRRLADEGLDTKTLIRRKKAANPKFVLRNYLAQRVIEAAQQGDFAPLKSYLSVLAHPYEEQPQSAEWAKPPPEWGKTLEISCSS